MVISPELKSKLIDRTIMIVLIVATSLASNIFVVGRYVEKLDSMSLRMNRIEEREGEREKAMSLFLSTQSRFETKSEVLDDRLDDLQNTNIELMKAVSQLRAEVYSYRIGKR